MRYMMRIEESRVLYSRMVAVCQPGKHTHTHTQKKKTIYLLLPDWKFSSSKGQRREMTLEMGIFRENGRNFPICPLFLSLYSSSYLFKSPSTSIICNRRENVRNKKWASAVHRLGHYTRKITSIFQVDSISYISLSLSPSLELLFSFSIQDVHVHIR